MGNFAENLNLGNRFRPPPRQRTATESLINIRPTIPSTDRHVGEMWLPDVTLFKFSRLCWLPAILSFQTDNNK